MLTCRKDMDHSTVLGVVEEVLAVSFRKEGTRLPEWRDPARNESVTVAQFMVGHTRVCSTLLEA